VVLAFVVILGAGCSIINAVLTTRASLSNAGWHVVATNIQGGTGHGADGTLVVGVDYRSAVVISAHAEASDVAHIIWDKTPGRFSFLKVTVDNAPGAVVRSPTYVFSHIQLVALFGPRPDKLDPTHWSTSPGSDARSCSERPRRLWSSP